MPAPDEAESSRAASTTPPPENESDPSKNSEKPTATFASLGIIPPLLEALGQMGFTKPTEIQADALGPALEGRDIIGVAETVWR
jgi:superfamily II DNA/RNA helicase